MRARIDNIPYPESGFAVDDVVLHDGAPMGSRLDRNGNEKSVFNVLEMFEAGKYSTYVVEAEVPSVDEIEVLEKLCDARELHMEDWAGNVRNLCKACSEGKPHKAHDKEGPKAPWQRERRIAIAARKSKDVESVLRKWVARVTDWSVALER